MRISSKWILAGGALAAILASVNASCAQQTIRVGWTIPAEESKYWMMRRPAEFPDIGKTYNIEWTQFQGTAPMTQALAAGALDCATQAPLSLANGVVGGGLKAYIVAQHVFEKPGGLVMSPHESGGQWDYPYAWAPNQLLADEGIRRYGFKEEADRVSYEFLSAVAENFRRDGTIREKYNAVTRSSETQVTAGYHMNIVGFGWTNGVFLALLNELPQASVARLADEQNNASGSATQ